jgi:hypothetical protein
MLTHTDVFFLTYPPVSPSPGSQAPGDALSNVLLAALVVTIFQMSIFELLFVPLVSYDDNTDTHLSVNSVISRSLCLYL